MKRRPIIAASILIALLPLVQQARASLVVNGGFETGDFTGWYTYGVGDHSVDSASAHSGSYGAEFGQTGGFVAAASQGFYTTPGQLYRIDFWLSNGPGSDSEFQLLWSAYGEPAHIAFDLVYPPEFAYQEYTFYESATSDLTVLGFQFYQNQSSFHLDDVSVTPVPEASTWLVGVATTAIMCGAAFQRSFPRGRIRSRGSALHPPSA